MDTSCAYLPVDAEHLPELRQHREPAGQRHQRGQPGLHGDGDERRWLQHAGHGHGDHLGPDHGRHDQRDPGLLHGSEHHAHRRSDGWCRSLLLPVEPRRPDHSGHQCDRCWFLQLPGYGQLWRQREHGQRERNGERPAVGERFPEPGQHLDIGQLELQQHGRRGHGQRVRFLRAYARC